MRDQMRDINRDQMRDIKRDQMRDIKRDLKRDQIRDIFLTLVQKNPREETFRNDE